ncbi:MAG: NAD(P) transhydrogenase subunit alpha [Acidimicrobiia bacterium]|nr:NAD(P) transhydrogenase subunit alpha [Acidimicrobiia bacterium]MDH5293161.1 NAD(P) transhydrogenase subunit alpha [Acidimicrobiia bacterium]
MQISVPRQTSPMERRVGLTPEVVKRLAAGGHAIVVESGAGLDAGYADTDFEEAGATICEPGSGWSGDLVVTIDRPSTDVTVSGAVLGLLRPFDEPEAMRDLAGRGLMTFAFEAVPRTTRAQVVDALSSQATVAGYQAVLEAAAHCDRLFPMLTTAAGTIRPSKVLILGAGVAGLQAIATARRLGAIVSAFDVRAAAADQVRSLGATFVEVGSEPQDAAAAGGYAREVADDAQAKILEGLAPHVAASDAIVSTAAIPGRPAPMLIDRSMVERMRPGAVIVDLAASTGGNCELTEPGETISHGGVSIVGATDLVSRVARDASAMYARNAAAFIELVTGEDGEFVPNWDDDIVAESCITRDGEVVHPRIKESQP